jgi:DNA-binding response OmpR family regulator
MARGTLLVIDDEPAIAALVRRAGEASGYDVTVTGRSEEFKRAISQARPAAICLDISMPGADGIELLRYLADHHVTARLLIISGFEPSIVRSASRFGEALGLNIAGVIPKPINMAALRKLLAEI